MDWDGMSRGMGRAMGRGMGRSNLLYKIKTTRVKLSQSEKKQGRHSYPILCAS